MKLVAGVDEVGRGCLAGPVIAAAVILTNNIPGLKDSKKLSKKKREELSLTIMKNSYFSFGCSSRVFPIICYKTNPLNFFIISRMLKVDDVGLPNLLLGSRKFPELIQKNCNAKSILNASKNINNMQSMSGQLRELLVGTKEEDYIKQILEL